MRALLIKDLCNSFRAVPPALLLGIPMLLILQFTRDYPGITALSAFWIVFFFSSTSLFFRSFALEHRSKNFQIYTLWKVSKWKVFLSQAFIQALSVFFLGLSYAILVKIFWNESVLISSSHIAILLLTSFCLAPIGSLLGLMLQVEREFLFSILYLPLSTPVILGAHSLFTDGGSVWLKVLLSFFIVGSFLSALIFEFYFDDLSETS